MDIARASIKRKTAVLFICLLIAIIGTKAYFQIGKLEDPTFTIKTAVITVTYPGANAYEVEQETVSRIEEAVQAMGEIKHIRSRSTPGMALIYVDIQDKYTVNDLPQIWNILRQKVFDAQVNMPSGCTIMIDNDYGDVYGQYYAIISDGHSIKKLYDYADFLKKELVLVPQVARVKIIGEQEEGIYIEFSASRMATLGISPEAIFGVLNLQNTLYALGSTKFGNRYVRISPTSKITSVEDIGNLIIGGVGGKITKLREVATIRRDYIAPQSFKMKFNGRPAIGLGIATVPGGNVVTMGEAISKRLAELEEFRPIGIELSKIYMQSEQVNSSIRSFIINLLESLVVVIGVLLISMGLRSGIIIGITLLLTIAGTFAIMNQTGIFLQIVSLGALIIALGSLVDNPIVIAEGILVGLESGKSFEDSASNTVNNSIWAMLGGTFIAIMAFVPIGLSNNSTGEFCRSLFQVVGISMMLSWISALVIPPVLGKIMLKSVEHKKAPYDKPIFRAYSTFLEFCLRHRLTTVISVIMLFIGSLRLYTNLPQSFLPDSNTVYYTVDLWSPQGTSLETQEQITRKLADYLSAQPNVRNISEFIGNGSLRFILYYAPPEPNTAFSQIIVEVKDGKDTRPMLMKTQRYLDEKIPNVEGVCKLFVRGGGLTPKIEVRFYGNDPVVLRELAEQARQIGEDDYAHNFVRHDWREPVEVLSPHILQDQMQNLGFSRPLINQAVLLSTTGMTIGVFRDGNKSLPIKAVLVPEERNQLEILRSLPVWSSIANAAVPLGTVFSDIDVIFEDDILIKRDRKRIITVASETKLGENTAAMLERIRPKIEAIKLPSGYSLEWGGEKENIDEAMNGMAAMFTPTIIIMFTIMVFLFNDFRQPLIIFCTLPLILIGVAIGLWAMNMSVSFLATIGVLSLVGMLAKNSIILLDQINSDFEAGKDQYQAIVETSVSRLRPVTMSAFTTVLGMFPLVWDLLFGPMAVTIMAGLTVSTILTLIIIPVLIAIVYRVPSP